MSLMIDRLILSRPESRRASFRSSEGGQRRDCVLCSVPLSLHSTNPTDSPDARIIVGALVVLSDCLCQWRKDPHLPYQGCPSATCRALTGLPAHGSGCDLPSAIADDKPHPPPSSGENTDARLGVIPKLTLISRPEVISAAYIYME